MERSDTNNAWHADQECDTVRIVSAGEFLRINTPAFLFVGGASIASAGVAVSSGTLRVAFALAAWWSMCGAIMLFIDFRRKRDVFRRLASLVDSPSRRRDRLPGYLSDTLCGRCIVWALRYRARRA